MSIDRTDLVRKAFEKKALAVDIPQQKISEYFAERVFDRAKMRKYLDPQTLQALFECIDEGKPLDRATADGVARGMKTWASLLQMNIPAAPRRQQ